MEEKIHEKTENKIIDLINQGAGGRLIVFKPEKSDKDLAVEKRGGYNKPPIFLKIYVQNALLKEENFIKNVSVDNLAKEDYVYLIFAYFDIIKQDIEDYVWFIPLIDFAGAKNQDLSKFLINKTDIVKFLLKKIGK